MTESEPPIDWSKTTFEGSRREQLRQAQKLTVRQRLEALDELTRLSNRLRTMPKQVPAAHRPSFVREPDAEYRVGPSHTEIVLEGCTPTPLANYLKALGVLRLLSVRHPETRGFWRGERFVLRTSLNRDAIEGFFLNDYKPSALVTPWNGRGGFLEGEDEEEEAEESARESTRAGALMVRTFSADVVADRFGSLKATLCAIEDIEAVAQLNRVRSELKRLKADEKVRGKRNLSEQEREKIKRQEAEARGAKSQLLLALRSSLPDDVLAWFDTCLSLVNDPKSPGNKRSAPSPLLGAGGLDGSMDFGVNYLKRINDVFDPVTGCPREGAREWLDAALFGAITDRLISKSLQDKKEISVGQFSPGSAGGYNAENGFTGEALLNPWDTILQLEGSVLFAASTVRRLEGSGDLYASLPFTVAPTAIGNAIALPDESPKGAKRRTAETWMPLWQRPSTSRELEAIFQEGRLTLGGRQVTNGFDAVRALASLGVSRGIGSFRRYAFLKRSGDAFFALDRGRFEVRESRYSSLVNDLEGRNHFLTRLHSFVRGRTKSGAWRASAELRSRSLDLDNLIVSFLQDDDRHSLLQVLLRLGEIQKLVAGSSEAKKAVPPIPRLSEAWVNAADGGSPAFRIAKALAGLRGVGDEPLPLRAQLFPVQRRFDEWMSAAAGEKVRFYTGEKGRLTETLRTLLERRLWLTEKLEMKDKPLSSPAGAMIQDVAAFLRDDRMDARIAALLPGLCLCEIPRDTDPTAGEGILPAAFGLLKATLIPDRILRALGWLGEREHLPLAGGMLAQLAAGNSDNRAVRTAWRRLRASGLNPAFAADPLPALRGFEPPRVAAALLIPLRYGATGALARSVLTTPETKPQAA